MKLIKLTMNAFSTYHQQTIIDFENMIDYGLYLISGPTGAGKTTIFDAITFALYGSASGSERSQNHFRSDYAHAQEETYVELTFELHQQLYTVKRSPTYLRQGYKTPKVANAYLMYDGHTIEGVKEVNQKIRQLLGVDVHQFKQIVMIAQGEFTKLIYASSEEREKVLRHIFHTESLVQFEELLRQKTKELKEQYSLSREKLISQYQLLSFPKEFMDLYQDGFHPFYIDDAKNENQKLQQEYQGLKDKYLEYKDNYNQLSQEYFQKEKHNQNILEYQSTLLEYQKHLKQKDAMAKYNQDIQKLKMIQENQTMIYQYQNTKNDLEKNQKELQKMLHNQEKAQYQFNQIKQDYQQLNQLRNQREQYILDIHQLKQLLEKQENYQKLSIEYQRIKTDYQKKKEQYDELFQLNQQLNKRMERDQDNVDKLPQLQLELEKMDQIAKETNQRRISIHDLSESYDQYKDYQDKHYELAQKYQKKDQEYQTLFQQYQQEDEKFKHQQAGILALHLQEGQPCPVCGSLHHPTLAQLSTQVLTSGELEKLAQDVEKAKEAKEDTYHEVLLQNEQIQRIKTKIDVYKKQLLIDDELSKEVFIHLLSNIIQLTKEQKKIYQKQYTEIEYLKKIQNSLKKDEIEYHQQTQQLEKYLQDIHEQEKKLTDLKARMESLNNDVSTDYQVIIQEKQGQLKELNQKIQHIDENYHHQQEELALMKQNILQLENDKQTLKVLFEQRKKDYNIFINHYFDNQEEYQSYLYQLDQLDFIEKQYQEYCIEERTLLSHLQKLDQYKDLKIIDLSFEKEKLSLLEEKRDRTFQMMNEKHVLYQQNDSLIKEIEKVFTKNQDIFHQYTLYQDLYDYSVGKNTQRMSFERYVLSSYFEHILEYANVELLKMSQGRFALYRKQEVKGSKQQGLDLSVLDYETGVMRDIQSLSGGESFKAALALALGLSSMIQSYAGGIELNTLFIDEGFGSLDSESLDQALAVLLDLKNDNKVIGIISHVRELKERISTQIVVEKSQKGSLLHIEKD